jgi:DNA repair protein RadC
MMNTGDFSVLLDDSSFVKLLAVNLGEQRARECTLRLLKKYGSVATVFSEHAEDIAAVADVSLSTALLIKLVAYLNSRRVTESFVFGAEYGEEELRAYLSALFLGASSETVYAILLDDKNRVISTEFISEGTINASDVIPRKILECAKRRKSKKIILAHNHPKGAATPSRDDILTTGRLFNILATVGVRLLAHYIVADGEVGRVESDMLYDPDYRG